MQPLAGHFPLDNAGRFAEKSVGKVQSQSGDTEKQDRATQNQLQIDMQPATSGSQLSL